MTKERLLHKEIFTKDRIEIGNCSEIGSVSNGSVGSENSTETYP